MKKNIQNKNILILGGSGFIGRATAIAFADAGAKVTITTTSKNNTPIFNTQKINVIKYNILENVNDLENLISNHDVIINLIALVNAHDVSASQESHEINVIFQKILLEAVIKNNPKCHIIFTSSQTVYGKIGNNPVDENSPTFPETVYAKQKREAEIIYEDYVKKHNILVTILRLSNVYGHGAKKSQSVISTFIENIINDREIKIFGSGDELRDYIYIDDVAEAILALSKISPKNIIYNCGSDQLYSVKNIVDHISDMTNFNKIINVPYPNGYAKYSGNIILNNTRFKEETEWLSKVDMEEGIGHMFKIYKK